MANRKISIVWLVLLGLMLIVLVDATTVSRRVKHKSGERAALHMSHESLKVGGSTQQAAQMDRRHLVRVFVHGDDIYPDLITVRPGKILLVAENETLSDVSLVVDRKNPGQAADRVTKLNTPQRDKRNKQELTLGAGEYVFYAESNPAVQGRLIVDPQNR